MRRCSLLRSRACRLYQVSTNENAKWSSRRFLGCCLPFMVLWNSQAAAVMSFVRHLQRWNCAVVVRWTCWCGFFKMLRFAPLNRWVDWSPRRWSQVLRNERFRPSRIFLLSAALVDLSSMVDSEAALQVPEHLPNWSNTKCEELTPPWLVQKDLLGAARRLTGVHEGSNTQYKYRDRDWARWIRVVKDCEGMSHGEGRSIAGGGQGCQVRTPPESLVLHIYTHRKEIIAWSDHAIPSK